MKTNPVQYSIDRNLFGTQVRSLPQKQMSCLTDIQKAYDIQAEIYGWKHREIKSILNINIAQANIERIYYMLESRNLMNVSFLTFMEQCRNETFIKMAKKMDFYKTTGRINNILVYAHDYICMIVAMELNPMFYAAVAKWAYDSLSYNRMFACDQNLILKNVICNTFNRPDANYYIDVNRKLNEIIFQNHFKDIRNTGSSQQLEELSELQKYYAKAIMDGLIKTAEDFISVLQKALNRKTTLKLN